MRFHCLGGTSIIPSPLTVLTLPSAVGSIGSLLASNLASLPSTQVRLILRRKDLAAQLLNPSSSHVGDGPAAGTPYGTLTVEREGIARRASSFEMELTRSPQDTLETSSLSSSSSRSPPKIDPRVWNRNDPIDTLVVTTKASSTLPALRHLLPRLSSRSTVVLCHNGMGVLEGLLAKYWPEDRSDQLERDSEGAGGASWSSEGGRPSFVCATTSHGAWRKGSGHFVHAGLGDLKFGVVPNRAVLSALSHYPTPSWSSPADNPLLNPRSLVQPTLDHLPYLPATASLHTTLSSLLQLHELKPSWLPLPTLQIAQLQKLAVNNSVNSLTALVGVNNGALVGSQKAKRIIESVCRECSAVFAAHLAREEGTWAPPPPADPSLDDLSFAPSSLSHPPPPPLPQSHPLSAPSLVDYTLRILFKTSSNISSTLADLLPLQFNSSSSFRLSQNAPSLPSRTEIEYINGYVVALGRRYGVETPTVKALGELVLLKEEMGRVGAVDQVWESHRKRPSPLPASTTPPSPTRSPSPPPKRSPSPPSSPPKSIFSRAPSSLAPSSSSSTSTSAAEPATASLARGHQRAADHARFEQEREGKRHEREMRKLKGRAEREGA